jgi:hypothetical protein
MKLFFYFCFVFFLIAAVVGAADMRQIELTDGSIVNAEVVSLSQGVYTVKSETLGTIKLPESKIRSIRTQAAGRSTDIPGKQADDMRSLQDKMMSDREIMSLVRSLGEDPQFRKILEDPAVMKAVEEGNIAALMANPQFLKLLDNATVQDIQKKVQ